MSEDSPALLNVPRPTLARAPTSTDLAGQASRIQLQTLKNTLLKSHGRPPWYGEDGQHISEAFVIGIAGGSASGKTHVARQIVQSLGSIPSIVILSQDSFYKRNSPEEIALAHANRKDFDHPDAIDMPLFAECLQDLKQGRQTNIPIYSFSEHQRLDETKYLYGAAVIITEGILALHDPVLRALYDLKIFVQCDSDLMLARRIRRDVSERGRTVEGVLDQYLRYVKPSYDNFVLPTSKYADIIVPGSDNHVAIDLICTHIKRQLKNRKSRLRAQMALAGPREQLSRQASPLMTFEDPWPGLVVIPETAQLKGILTILRDRTTSREDFIFFTDRLATYLIEKAMEHLPHASRSVVTPCAAAYHGRALDVPLCGVSILRSGGPLERGLRRVVNNVAIGSLLIQSEPATGEPLLLHLALPQAVRERTRAGDTYVFLLDAQIGTAASAFMAIRVLLDHGVAQEHIVFVTLLVARLGGLALLRRVFPRVTLVCAAVDERLEERWLELLEPDAGLDGFDGGDGFDGDGNGEAVVVGGGKGDGEGSGGALRPHAADGPPHGRKVWVVEPGMGHIGDRYYL
ncbi:uridine kinase family protein [Phanerochaete sordida]|uniref:Uridine kinase n=1 Tax=Phanerochaete sordida TaxID=48140 RepID=A0A9P3G5J3_9APHY|nr:uridine kinase family protein [Phanerochaete sordida]